MNQSVMHMNIERFRRLIFEETDPSKRTRLEGLLAEEQVKLRATGFHPGSDLLRG